MSFVRLSQSVISISHWKPVGVRETTSSRDPIIPVPINNFIAWYYVPVYIYVSIILYCGHDRSISKFDMCVRDRERVCVCIYVYVFICCYWSIYVCVYLTGVFMVWLTCKQIHSSNRGSSLQAREPTSVGFLLSAKFHAVINTVCTVLGWRNPAASGKVNTRQAQWIMQGMDAFTKDAEK